MSAEGAEKVKNKLMEILEEELSALNLRKVKLEDINRNESDSLQEGEEINIDKREAFGSSDDNTAEVLHKATGEENEEECEINMRAFDPPSDDEKMRQNNHAHEQRESIHKEKMFNPDKRADVNKYWRQNYNDENKPMENDEPFVPPSDSLAERIMRRAEFYFQDYNIFKNSYLLNLIRRNKKGYISLKVIASLRKIRALTKDYRVVAYSLMKSDMLELNPEKSKIRRVEPIPKIENTSFGKTVMIFNLPQHTSSGDSLKELFVKFGTVVSAGVFEISSPESDVYHKRCLYFHRKIATQKYGLVEFEKYDEVVNVLKDRDGSLAKENEMKVVPLMPQIYKRERRYLKFVEQYNPFQRRNCGRFKPRGESRAVENDVHFRKAENAEVVKSGKFSMGGCNGGSGEIARSKKTNMEDYPYKRGYFRRPYGSRKGFVPSNSKNNPEGQVTNDYSGSRKYKWEESRHLKLNSSINIDRIYPNVHPKAPSHAHVSSNVM